MSSPMCQSMKRLIFKASIVSSLAILGYVSNALALSGPTTPGINFMFGSVAVLLSATLFGPASGLVAGLASALPTVEAWGHCWALLVLSAEGLVCGLLVHRFKVSDARRFSLSVTLANVGFWACLGVPLGYAVYSHLLTVPSSSVNLIITKWAMNGVFNAALVEFLLFLLIAPNIGGWLRAQGAHISRWRIRDMYVASIVVATVSIVLVTIVIESRRHLEEQYEVQRQHQEQTLALIQQLLPLGASAAVTAQQQAAISQVLQSAQPEYSLRFSSPGRTLEFGNYPGAVATDGPVYEATQPASMQAREMGEWLDAYMIIRSVDAESQSTLVLVSKLQPLIESLWKNTAEVLGSSGVALFIIMLLGLVFSRYATRSLTQLANASASIGAQHQHGARLYQEISDSEGFEPKESHDVRIAISTALLEEARAYQASAAAAANYLKIIEEANAPIVAIDMAGAIVGWNRASERATGLHQDAVLGQKTEDVLIDSIPKVDSNRIITRLRKGGSLEGMRLSFKNTDGRRVTLLLSGVVLNNPEGEPDRLIMVGQNLTDYLEQEQQLLQASKMSTLGEMATGVAHELNQPLNAMRLTIANLQSLIVRKPDQIGTVGDKLKRLNEQIDRATKIIDHLRLYGRRSDASSTLGTAVFKPDIAIENGIGLFQEQFRVANILLTCALQADVAVVKGDGMLFEQVLVNLLSNARDAINAHMATNEKEVSVRSWVNGNSVVITVEDTGGGADNYVLSHMFEPFYTSKAPGQGTGLGLSIAYSIISSMGGSIAAHNASRGMCVTITLPVESASSIAVME